MPTPHKKTNNRQFERLVELMKMNVDLARGFCGVGSSKTNVKEKWEEIGKELDLLGPPMRLGSEWHKVWIDMKGKVKKILGSNKGEFRATGGGPNRVKQLSPLQQEIDMLLNISSNVNPAGNSFGCNDHSELNSENIAPTNIEYGLGAGTSSRCISPAISYTGNDITPEQWPAGSSNVHSTPRRLNRRRAAETERSELLKKQTDLQECTLNKFKKIEENTYKISKTLQKLVDAKLEQNEIMRADARQRQMDYLEKRKLKVRELDLKQKEIELRKRELDLKEALKE